MRKLCQCKQGIGEDSYDLAPDGTPQIIMLEKKCIRMKEALPVYTCRMTDAVRRDYCWYKHCNYPMLALEMTLNGKMEYLSEKGRVVTSAGELYVISPGSWVRMVKYSGSPRRVLTLLVCGKALGTFLEVLRLQEQTLIRLKEPSAAEAMMRRIGDAIEKEDSGRENSMLTYEFLLYLAAELPPALKEIPPVEQAVSLLNKHYGKAIAIPQLAAELQISPATLTRLFRRQFGVSPYDYLLSLRLRKAAEKLKETNLPVKEIAFSCGFNSPAAFSAAFKAAFGVTPSQKRS